MALLTDWSTNQARGVACLALTSSQAVDIAMRPEMQAVPAAVGGAAGAGRLRVCGASASSALEDSFGGSLSPGMRKLVAALESKVKEALGSSQHSIAPPTLRHLLLCCNAAAATAAVDEFCAVARSGTPKQPGMLLTTGLLKQRRLSGGDVWLGRVHGKPLPTAEARRLERLLESLDWASMPAEGKLRGEMAEQSFKLGLSTKTWGKQNGPYVPFAFKAGFGVWDAASVTRRRHELWEA